MEELLPGPMHKLDVQASIKIMFSPFPSVKVCKAPEQEEWNGNSTQSLP
jgi:hypothetical protein